MEIEDAMVHLRREGVPEWTSFEKEADGETLVRRFNSQSNLQAWTLSMRQQDVKMDWKVILNGNTLGRLTLDENDLRSDFLVPHGAVNDGTNILEIHQTPGGEIDDIRVGEIRLHPVDPQTLRNAAQIEIVLVENIDTPTPGRITIVDENGTLLPVGAVSADGLAVRTGVVYTASGNAKFGVSDGRIRVYGGRGLEFSVADSPMDVKAGDKLRKVLTIQRELDTQGWIACDTHIHTATFSGHGDCTIDERMVTLAGEGIELAFATDHNQHIDYRPYAATAGVETRFTSVIGNEVTTKHAHISIFPVAEGSLIPDPSQADWGLIFENIFATPNVRVAILNHARDIHSGFRPFSPRHHISLTGENLDGQAMQFNAMEVINSGATQTEPKQLFYDWCGLINRGLRVTPVGSSDSHDVSRFIVGQGRTYIQCDDSDVADIDVAAAVDAFVSGRVVVSYGLFPELKVETSSGSIHRGTGNLLTLEAGDEYIALTVTVQSPTWTSADEVEVFVCGERRFYQSQDDSNLNHDGSPRIYSWRIPRAELRHDIWITALASGPGVVAPYWPYAKPYQPMSPSFTPRSLGLTGPIRIDVDGDGRWSSPLDYARQIVQAHGSDPQTLVDQLSEYSPSVDHHVASLLRTNGSDLNELVAFSQGATQRALLAYQRAWQESLRATAEGVE